MTGVSFMCFKCWPLAEVERNLPTKRAVRARSVAEVRCQISILWLCPALSLLLVPKAFIDSSPSMGTPIHVMQVSKRKMKIKFTV